MNIEHQQLHGAVRTLTAGIEKIIKQQIKLISTEVDLGKTLSGLISEICASYDFEECAVCDRLLGMEADTGSTPEDVFSCLVVYPAALQYASKSNHDDSQQKVETKRVFYQRYLKPAIQCAWRFLSKSIGVWDSRHCEIKDSVGMIITKMDTTGQRGRRTHSKMTCPYVSPYPSFSELYLCLEKFAKFLRKSFDGRLGNFNMSASVVQVNQFIADEDDNDGNNHTQDCDDNNDDDKDELYGVDDDKERNKKVQAVTPDRSQKRKLRNTILNQVENKKVRGNNNGNSIMADHFECDTSSDDNDGGRTMALLTKYCKAAGAGWDPEKLLRYPKSEKKLEIESIILRATTLKQIASTLNSAYIKDGKVWMDVLDENKFRNSPLVAAFLLVNLVR